MPAAVEEEKPETRKCGVGNVSDCRADCRAVCVSRRVSSVCQCASMSTLRYGLRNLFQRKSIGRYGHIQDLQGVPFYEARQPWWAKFTWGFIAADLFVT